MEDGRADLCGPLGPDFLGLGVKEFPFGVLGIGLAGIGDLLSADEDEAGICREKDRGWVAIPFSGWRGTCVPSAGHDVLYSLYCKVTELTSPARETDRAYCAWPSPTRKQEPRVASLRSSLDDLSRCEGRGPGPGPAASAYPSRAGVWGWPCGDAGVL